MTLNLKEIEASFTDEPYDWEQYHNLVDDCKKLLRALRKTRTALQPFAAKAKQLDAVHVMPAWSSVEIALDDLRRARTVLEGVQDQGTAGGPT